MPDGLREIETQTPSAGCPRSREAKGWYEKSPATRHIELVMTVNLNPDDCGGSLFSERTKFDVS